MRLTPQQIEAWVSKHFKFKKRSGGRQLVINNPFDGDAGWHFWVSLSETKSKRTGRKDYWVHDFRPGHNQWDGSFLKFVQRYRSISYFEAVKEVSGSARNAKELLLSIKSQFDELESQEPEEKLLELPEDAVQISDDGPKLQKIAVNYLKSRCVNLEQAKTNFIHYTPNSIVFPYLEYGMVVYWQERDILQKRFRFPDEAISGVAKTDFLYGFDDVEPKEYVIITEAIFDKLSVGDNCVASGGAVVAGKQIRKLQALDPKMIILAPDNDEAGIISLRHNHEVLRKYFIGKIAYCLPPKIEGIDKDLGDWNSLDQEFNKGWSRRYIEDHSRKLDIRSLIRPKINVIQSEVNLG